MTIPDSESYLKAVFSKDGYLAQKFDGYRVRFGQVELARAIDAAISGRDGKEHAIAEGPTGTGKSLAYLVPATYKASTEGRRVIVATANIALQEQLITKDLPLLQEILPWPFTFALLKGFSNYLCLDALEESQSDKQLGLKFAGGFDRSDAAQAGQAEQIIEWSSLTKTGDKSELPFVPGRAWGAFSIPSDECKRDKCEHANDCFVLNAIEQAKTADVIVTNFHMLFAHIAVSMKTGRMISLLPMQNAIVICDEAHKMPDVAREFFGDTASVGAFKNRLKKARKKGSEPHRDGVSQGVLDEAEQAVNDFFFEVTRFMQDRQSYQDRLRGAVRIETDPLFDKLNTARGAIRRKSVELAMGDKKTMARSDELSRINDRIYELQTHIANAFEQKGEPEIVYYLEPDRADRATIRSKVVNVAPILARELFRCGPIADDPDAEDVRPAHAILTSATIAISGSFDFIARELGAPMSRTQTVIGRTPFREDQSLLIVPRDVPFANGASADDYARAVPELVADVIRRASGRTLALFTSYRNLNATRDHLLREGMRHRLLVQGDAPRTQLVEKFKEDVSSVLLGTESFWAGVDVPGEALSCVVIDRLPFPSPGDPVLSMLNDQDPKAFFTEMIPRAAIQLKQGIGRLIRTVTDRGVIVILDRRICDRGYGQTFLNGLPPMLKSRDLNAVGEFLNADQSR